MIGIRKNLAMGAVALTASLGLFSTHANAQAAPGGEAPAGDWIQDLLNPSCSPESREQLAGNVRDKIEQSVARAMAAIQPPAAVGDLSCLNDLMNAPLDTFSNIGGILGNLQGGLGGSIGSITGDLDVSRRVCEFAAEKWQEVAGPLQQGIDDLGGAGSSIWDNFDLSRNGSAPSNSGSGSGQWNPNGPNDDLTHDSIEDDEQETLPPMRADCSAYEVAMDVCRPTPPAPSTPTPTAPESQEGGTSSQSNIWGNLTGGNN